ncbi:TetR/AcrR family transcriptional regulator [Streptomyces hainanensis]|uniref:TetR family transcriptional regulator n=1 Tax=Streptomyces hainanensis TaxID=402648 RepID=A0A4R4T0X8_9ACTN|nr:TetR family transcriptional regulator [Streptomyces hainanensis]TDC68069.1 TetR family transcriptional regulator [Streptomyces hainanensis]
MATLRERRRAETRREIGERAAELFERQGFAATTVEEIAEAAGISLRTFYRHCPVKEEALTPLLIQGVFDLAGELARQPEDEPLAVAARAAILRSAAHHDDAFWRRVVPVVLAEPALRASWLSAGRQAQETLIPLVADRLGCAETALRARVTAGLLINVATTVVEHWAGTDAATPLDAVVAEAFEAAAAFGTD